MTTSRAKDAASTDPVTREPFAAESERVLHLFRSVSLCREARLLVAVRSRPIERFVAAVAWWPEGTFGRFHLACQPGADRMAMAGLLIDRLADCAREAGLESLQYADLLPDQHEWTEVLRVHGFERLRSERSFEVPVRNVWLRVTQLYQKHKSQIPTGWRTDPIRGHAPEVILELIAPHRLLPPADVRNFWGKSAAAGFDLDLSCILFDRERPFGTLLLRRFADLLYVDIQVVHEPNPRLRSLADLCLIYHDALRVEPDGPIRRIQFRSGETEHRQTANLAFRMGGQELPQRHVLARNL